MKEIAQEIEGDTKALMERWEGNPEHIIEDIFRVRNLDTKEIIPLELTFYQKQFVRAYFFADESTINVNKGRRTGYSYITCACILLDAIQTPHSFMAITAPSKSQAKDRIEDIYDLMELARFEIETPIDNRDEIKLYNESQIMAFSGNPDTSRGGDSADTLYIDEMDFLDDQSESMRAFSPFIALGDAQMIEVSTPKSKNSLFMENQKKGTPSGENGIISIEQPAFKNASEIDIERSLIEQDAEPVMPYLDLQKAEKSRARDPTGFKQEYLCVPAEDEYRFFDDETVENAIQKGEKDDYEYGFGAKAQHGGKMVMAVDFAGGGKDDTAVVIVEHVGEQRLLRYYETITNDLLRKSGIDPPIAKNPSAVASRIKQLHQIHGVDKVITDATNLGEGFDSEIRQKVGRGINSFNFSDRESVDEMMKDVNYGFHNNNITLVKDKMLKEQLLAIVKDRTKKGSTPRYSGKDHAPKGKDDVAIAFSLAAYPPNMNTEDRELQEPTEDDITIEQGDTQSLNVSQQNSFNGGIHRSGFSGGSKASNNSGRRYDRQHRR